jgi:hypothetical protein
MLKRVLGILCIVMASMVVVVGATGCDSGTKPTTSTTK